MRRLLPFASLLLLAACDPPPGLYDAGTVAITARVLNPRPIIHLGDSVAFYFAVPDSVTLNGTRIAVSAGNKDGATIGFDANKINSSAIAGFQINPPSCQIYANPGSLTANGTLEINSLNGRIVGRYYMIPKQKGIYFFDQSELGYADLNDRKLMIRFSINFGNVNRSHQMLIDSAGAANRFDMYLRGRINQGFEVYGFRVI
jgi:hypothetical protein